jgi:peroxiredoxin
VLSVKAQVYVLDAATSNWAPASTTIINVALFYDPNTNFTRAVGMENSQARTHTERKCGSQGEARAVPVPSYAHTDAPRAS